MSKTDRLDPSCNYTGAFMTFEEMIHDKYGNINKNCSVISAGMYSTHIKNWLKYFSMDQILILNGEELVKYPYNEVKKLETFLNLKPLIKEEHFVYKEDRGFYCIKKPLNSENVQCLTEDKGRKHPNISLELIEKLNKFYEPLSHELFQMINRTRFWEK